MRGIYEAGKCVCHYGGDLCACTFNRRAEAESSDCVKPDCARRCRLRGTEPTQSFDNRKPWYKRVRVDLWNFVLYFIVSISQSFMICQKRVDK